MVNLAAMAPIDCWLFDLDNTLYPPELALFSQIDARMGAFICQLEGCDAATARIIQKRYFHDHGTTLAGLMRHHGVEPEAFLTFVHDIDLAHVTPDFALREAIAALPGAKHIFTNADADYAQRVLAARGLDGLFEVIVDVRRTGYCPKPEAAAYRALIDALPAMDPTRTVFVDDMSRNLRPAKHLGMVTVWLDNGSESGGHDHHPDHVDHQVDDLLMWLQGTARHLAGLATASASA